MCIRACSVLSLWERRTGGRRNGNGCRRKRSAPLSLARWPPRCTAGLASTVLTVCTATLAHRPRRTRMCGEGVGVVWCGTVRAPMARTRFRSRGHIISGVVSRCSVIPACPSHKRRANLDSKKGSQALRSPASKHLELTCATLRMSKYSTVPRPRPSFVNKWKNVETNNTREQGNEGLGGGNHRQGCQGPCPQGDAIIPRHRDTGANCAHAPADAKSAAFSADNRGEAVEARGERPCVEG